jgi:V8-like Glu-specific endopeptidase
MAAEHFEHEQIVSLFDAAVRAGLAAPGNRASLLAGIDRHFVARLPAAADPGAQLLSDLQTLNGTERLASGAVPLRIWLGAAAALASGTDEARFFRQALDQLDRRVTGGPPLPDPQTLEEYRETIVHQDDTVPFSFLAAGADAGRSVAKLSVPRIEDGEQRRLAWNGSPVIYLGTGWLITQDLLVTNYHVVNARESSEGDAAVPDLMRQVAHMTIEFGCDSWGAQAEQVPVRSLEAWGRQLDYAILRLVAPAGRPPLRVATSRLVKRRNEYTPVNIIQHPDGGPKRIAIRNNLITASTDTQLRYFTDTNRGSSGAPVFDDSWTVVALHWGSTAAEGVRFQGRSTAWVNVGTHITAILDHLHAHSRSIGEEVAANGRAAAAGRPPPDGLPPPGSGPQERVDNGAGLGVGDGTRPRLARRHLD